MRRRLTVRRTLTRRIARLALAAWLVGAGGTLVEPAPAPAAGPALVKLQLGMIGGVSDAAFFIAIDKGYFREQGIEIAASRLGSAAHMVAPLGTGHLHVGGGAPSAGLLNAIAREVPLRIVADKGNMAPGHGYEAIVVRRELWQRGALKSPADLRGRRIAIAARSISPEVILDTFLRRGGLTVNDVDVVTLAHADMAAALANGSIDVALPIEPFVTHIAEKGIGVIWKRDDEILPGHQVAVVLYSPKFVEDKAELAHKFMLAYLKGARDYNDAFVKKDAGKRREVVQILTRDTSIKDPALYDKMVMPGIDPNGRVNLESLAHQQEWFLAKGSQKARVDLSRVVDTQFADSAVRVLGVYR